MIEVLYGPSDLCPPNTPVSLDKLRIPGVLQRLAWSYLVVASLDLLVARGNLDILTTVSCHWTHITLTFIYTLILYDACVYM